MSSAKEKTIRRYPSPFSLHPSIPFFLLSFSIPLAIILTYSIRTHALDTYGYVIHEFDPWFNFRATDYLSKHGWNKFIHWFDHRSWYPIGRPVGTTIYPGMQVISVFLYDFLQSNTFNLPKYTLNEVCCLVPIWFACISTISTGLMSITTIKSDSIYSKIAIFALTSLIMSLIPAHTMRSVGGGFDNESVALPLLCTTFLLYTKSLGAQSIFSAVFWGVLTAASYAAMGASWGGFIFVGNLIAFHALYLSFRSVNFSIFSPLENNPNLVYTYSTFFIFATLGLIQVPVVGLSPLKSLEQLFLLAVFGWINLHHLAYRLTPRFKGRGAEDKYKEAYTKRCFFVFSIAGGIGLVVCAYLLNQGYFGPLGARIRGLFVPHTRTGNPLVDSVAEHRSTHPSAYYRYLHLNAFSTIIGFFIILQKPMDKEWNQRSFLIMYVSTAYYFSTKMVRLILLLAPIVSILSAVGIDFLIRWSYTQLFCQDADPLELPPRNPKNEDLKKKKKKGKKQQEKNELDEIKEEMQATYSSDTWRFGRKATAGAFIFIVTKSMMNFYFHAKLMGIRSSHPSIMYQTRMGGETIIVDDYREAYWWLRDNTDEDARVLSWWDYGYQLSGIGEKITLADGNTWNHEHIATIGKILASPVDKAHDMVIHLADYILVWCGGGGDDLAKSPHIARIANSVYRDVCGEEDPLCRNFGFKNRDRNAPTDMMEKSLVYHLVQVDEKKIEDMFEEVFVSKFGKVRVWKINGVDEESKKYTFSSESKVCDQGGTGWICPGKYPPKFLPYIESQKNFQQLEDFNAAKVDEEYQRKYHSAFTQKEKQKK
eukprot:snap_masked-scaffold_74-processed-gene-0.40-mRNA-1 protein AED:0.02 eAED:0.02 QI:0/0/0/1/1/1/2/0/819